MTTGTGIVLAAVVYCAMHVGIYIFQYRADLRIRKPASVEARLSRVERWLKEEAGYHS